MVCEYSEEIGLIVGSIALSCLLGISEYLGSTGKTEASSIVMAIWTKLKGKKKGEYDLLQ